MNEPKRGSGRLQLLVIALVFFGPLIFAAWLYYSGKLFAPDGRSNHGTLLEPIVNLADALPDSPLRAAGDRSWLLVFEHAGPCGEACAERLYALRQLRLMLGKEMDRVRRVFLHGGSEPDTVIADREAAGLITLEDAQLTALLDNKKPADLAGGGYYLIDPHGNLVMYFHPALEPGDVVDDIKRLLRLSRIG